VDQIEVTAMKMILVVEDDEMISDVIAMMIKQDTMHYPVIVPDGLTAEDVTRDIKPDLLLLDYLLPDMNGIDLYDRLHRREELCDVPALLLSAYMSRADLQEAVRARNLPVLSKPFALTELLVVIEQHLVA
jgi:DNA-binding response OmpR family regulator